MDAKKIISLNPSKNYAIIGEVSVSSHDEINNKIAQARAAQPAWAALEVEERVKYLGKCTQHMWTIQRKLHRSLLKKWECQFLYVVKEKWFLDFSTCVAI